MNHPESQLSQIQEELTQVRIAVGRLEALFDDGPGKWASCQHHANALALLERRMTWLEKKIWMGMGVLAVLVFVAPFIVEHFRKP